MVIRRQPIIPWLLDPSKRVDISEITLPLLSDQNSHYFLLRRFSRLKNLHSAGIPSWGVPLLTLPSLEQSLIRLSDELSEADYWTMVSEMRDGDCGVLMTDQFGTLAYGFHEGALYVWGFQMRSARSILYLYFEARQYQEGRRRLTICPNLVQCPEIFDQSAEGRSEIYWAVCNFITIFAGLMRRGVLRSVLVPDGKTIKLDAMGLSLKDKFRNESTHPLIVFEGTNLEAWLDGGIYQREGLSGLEKATVSEPRLSAFMGRNFAMAIPGTEPPEAPAQQ